MELENGKTFLKCSFLQIIMNSQNTKSAIGGNLQKSSLRQSLHCSCASQIAVEAEEQPLAEAPAARVHKAHGHILAFWGTNQTQKTRLNGIEKGHGGVQIRSGVECIYIYVLTYTYIHLCNYSCMDGMSLPSLFAIQ